MAIRGDGNWWGCWARCVATTLAIVWSLHATLSHAAEALPLYRITPLSAASPGATLNPVDINDAGLIVGAATSGEFLSQGFALSGGQLTLLARLPDEGYSMAAAVNNFGQIVGRSDEDGIPKAAFWSSASASPVELPSSGGGGANVYATNLNDAGRVTGFYTSSGSGQVNHWEAISWQRDNRGRWDGTDLAQPAPPAPGTFTAGYGINSAGIIVGTGASSEPSVSQAALRWPSANAVAPLEAIAPVVFPRYTAEAINNDGVAAGWVVDTGGNSTPWRWDADRSAVALGLPPGVTSAQAIDINDAEIILANGTNNPSGAWERPFLYAGGEWVDLNERVLGGAGWRLTTAAAINSGGQIVGMGWLDGTTTGYLLTPVSGAAAGDFDADGDADGQDLLVWQRELGAIGNSTADANGDGRVDGIDLAVWGAAFGEGTLQRNVAATSAFITPEPASAVLAVGALGGTLAIRRRTFVQLSRSRWRLTRRYMQKLNATEFVPKDFGRRAIAESLAWSLVE